MTFTVVSHLVVGTDNIVETFTVIKHLLVGTNNIYSDIYCNITSGGGN